jgi:hypothetical protein
MSAQAAAFLPTPAPPAREERIRRLRPLDQPAPRRRPKLGYALTALAGALLIAGAQIALTLATTHDSFVLAELNTQQRSLTLEAQALEEQLAGVSSPQSLATQANALGMVVAGTASYLRLSDGAVAGSGVGAGWISTVDPNGAGAVANSLLDARTAAAATQSAATDEEPETTQADPASQLPPTLTEGLPTPSTH